MSTLSSRATTISKDKSTVFYESFRTCLTDPYHPTDNPDGFINMGTAQNHINDDLLIPKLESLNSITSAQLRYFPYNGLLEFRTEIGRFLTEKTNADVVITADEVSVANGCSSIFCSLSYMIGEIGDHYLTPSPYYSTISIYMGNYMGLHPIGVRLDTDEMVSVAYERAYERAIAQGQRVCGVVLVSPDNPTGAFCTREFVLEILEFAKSHSLHVIIDEIYMLGVFEEGTFQSCLSYSKEWPDPERTHFIWGFSKDLALSGARCGVVYTKNRAIHAALDGDVGFYHAVPAMVQIRLCALLRDTEWVDGYLRESTRRLQHHANIVMETLDKLGISYLKPQATLFVWVDFTPVFKTFPSDNEAKAIFDNMLLDHRIFITPHMEFKEAEPQFFRLVFSIPEGELIEGLRRFEGFVKAYKSTSVVS